MARTQITPREGELPEELALRRLIAKERLKIAKAAIKSGALSTYAAADTGRRNKDWQARNGSADLAIIPDSTTLNARARQMVRDSWIGQSIVRAERRNVVGRGIAVIPHAKDAAGKPLTELNRIAQTEFNKWAKSKLCDVERKQTFAQKQGLAVKERATVGESLWVWSYRIPIGRDGRIDKSRPVGLQLQTFEPEQFDLRILSFEGREVRGGVEIDENGAPLAYHLYTRNPNDVLYRHAFFSERVPAERVFHFFEGERVLQSRGVTPLAPVLQDARDADRCKSATLTRMLMEACVGLIIKQMNLTSGVPGINAPTLTPAPGSSSQTNSGMTQADFVPGMVANLQVGEDVEPFIPSSPGNQYGPFMEQTVRGIGAGVGISGGQIMRRSESNYSAARQDMLEDRKEWETKQDLIVDDLIRPTYETWFNFAALEGRFDGVEGFDMDAFLADRSRFVEADYVPPPQTWIDPEKEAQAFAIMLQNRLITREEIVAMRGGRFSHVVEKLAKERETAQSLSLSLPEDATERAQLAELVKTILGNRLGTIDSVAANFTDIAKLLEAIGVPVRNGGIQPPLPVVAAPGNLVTGDPAKNSKGQVIGGTVEEAVAPPLPKPIPETGPKEPAAKTALSSDSNGQWRGARERTNDYSLTILTPPPNVPNYGPADTPVMSCASCSYLVGERCSRFNFSVHADYVCDDWSAKTITENIGAPNTAKTFPPGPQDGDPTLESRFFPDADPTPHP